MGEATAFQVSSHGPLVPAGVASASTNRPPVCSLILLPTILKALFWLGRGGGTHFIVSIVFKYAEHSVSSDGKLEILLVLAAGSSRCVV